MKAAVVVPTIRRDSIVEFLKAWETEFDGHIVIVVEDNEKRSFDLPSDEVEHYSWEEIDKELKQDSWIIPRRTDCVRSYGFLKAWQRDVDFIVSLDDDCYPVEPGFVSKHWEMLCTSASSSAWVSTGRGVTPRGMPYFRTSRSKECVLNHGLWQNIPDYDAVTQLVNSRLNSKFEPLDQVIPQGAFFPMCGMNIAFKKKAIPAMYFLLMGRDWPFDRFGDIWCGVIVKRICDHLGYGVSSGRPIIDHRRASNVWANLRKEVAGYEVNEMFWQMVDSLVLTNGTFEGCYLELAEKLAIPGEYWQRLRTAMKIWASLFV